MLMFTPANWLIGSGGDDGTPNVAVERTLGRAFALSPCPSAFMTHIPLTARSSVCPPFVFSP